MSITFRPAERRVGRLLIGLAGGTGSGKTYSALLLATGLAGRDGKIAFVDTEQGRAEQYAPVAGQAPDYVKTFAFDSAYLSAPFTQQRYQEAAEAAAAHVGDRGVVVIDSMSHEWEGEGGMMEQADTIAQAMAAKSGKSPETYSFPSWREPKQLHTRFVNKLLQLPCHIILCFRAKEKNKMIEKKGSDGRIRKEPTPIGLQPIMEENFPFETSFLAMLQQQRPGVPEFSVKPLALPFHDIFKNGERISEALGQRLASYAASTPPPRPFDQTGSVAAAIEKYRAEGMAGLKSYVSGLSKPEQAFLRARHKEITTADSTTTDTATTEQIPTATEEFT